MNYSSGGTAYLPERENGGRMFKVYDMTRDKQGTPVLRHLADCETWRDTKAYRRLQKYQRSLPDKTPITSVVYHELTGAFLCSP